MVVFLARLTINECHELVHMRVPNDEQNKAQSKKKNYDAENRQKLRVIYGHVYSAAHT